MPRVDRHLNFKLADHDSSCGNGGPGPLHVVDREKVVGPSNHNDGVASCSECNEDCIHTLAINGDGCDSSWCV